MAIAIVVLLILRTSNALQRERQIAEVHFCGYITNGCQSELLGQFRLISDRASDVSGGRICLTQNAYAEI